MTSCTPDHPSIIYLDSASSEDAERAAQLCYVTGITTNPTLMAAAGRPPLDQLTCLLESFPGPVFYQLTCLDAELGRREATQAIERDPGRVVLKIPARADLFGMAAALVREGAACAMTAVYSPAQALLAAQVGASWVILYVDRARRLIDGNEDLVRQMAAVLARQHSTKILGASIKSPDQAVRTIVGGAHAITMPLPIIEQMADHPLSERAIDEFMKDRWLG